MKTYQNGSQVEYGIYVSPKSIDCRFVGADSETLDGKPNATYYRLPTLLAVAAAPVLGGLFVMTFPIIVVMMFLSAVIRIGVEEVSAWMSKGAYVVDMQWQPTGAFLNKKRDGKNEDKNEEKKDEVKKE